MFIEYMTYRYHGHSMSDPGVTYRTREEIKHVRDYRDPIGLVKHMLIENSWATDKELKAVEKEIMLKKLLELSERNEIKRRIGHAFLHVLKFITLK